MSKNTYKHMSPDAAAVAVTQSGDECSVTIVFLGTMFFKKKDRAKVAKLLENAAKMVRQQIV